MKTRLLFFVLVNRLAKMLAGEKKTKFALVMVIQDSCTIFWKKKIPLTSPEEARKWVLIGIHTNIDAC